jgi:hypothetical protein
MPSNVITPDSLGPEIESHLELLVEQAEDAEGKADLGPIVSEMCLYYRALAICMLADDGNVNDFFHWLLHSPIARRHYLRSVYGPGRGQPGDGRLSFVDPVLDAAAARQWPLAAEIQTLSAKQWLDGEEYEDDFCYGDFLRRAVAESLTADTLDPWRRALEGGKDPRLTVAEALCAKDAEQFEEALRALLKANEAKARAMADPRSPSALAGDYTFAPNRWVSVEGLALLALAERAGLSTEYEVEFCPAIARKGSYAPFRPRAYPKQPL